MTYQNNLFITHQSQASIFTSVCFNLFIIVQLIMGSFPLGETQSIYLLCSSQEDKLWLWAAGIAFWAFVFLYSHAKRTREMCFEYILEIKKTYTEQRVKIEGIDHRIMSIVDNIRELDSKLKELDNSHDDLDDDVSEIKESLLSVNKEIESLSCDLDLLDDRVMTIEEDRDEDEEDE